MNDYKYRNTPEYKKICRQLDAIFLYIYKLSAGLFFVSAMLILENSDKIDTIPNYFRIIIFILALLNMTMLNVKRIISRD